MSEGLESPSARMNEFLCEMCDCELCCQSDFDCDMHTDSQKFDILVNETCSSADTSVWSWEGLNTSIGSAQSFCDTSFTSVSEMSLSLDENESVQSCDETVLCESDMYDCDLDDFYNEMFVEVNLDIDECTYQSYDRVDMFEDEMYVYTGDLY